MHECKEEDDILYAVKEWKLDLIVGKKGTLRMMLFQWEGECNTPILTPRVM
jgi:hypothetical protein